MLEKRTQYMVKTLESSLLRSTISPGKLENLINDVCMTKDGWELAWIFVEEKRKYLLFTKKTVFVVFKRSMA